MRDRRGHTEHVLHALNRRVVRNDFGFRRHRLRARRGGKRQNKNKSKQRKSHERPPGIRERSASYSQGRVNPDLCFGGTPSPLLSSFRNHEGLSTTSVAHRFACAQRHIHLVRDWREQIPRRGHEMVLRCRSRWKTAKTRRLLAHGIGRGHPAAETYARDWLCSLQTGNRRQTPGASAEFSGHESAHALRYRSRYLPPWSAHATRGRGQPSHTADAEKVCGNCQQVAGNEAQSTRLLRSLAKSANQFSALGR